MTSVIGSGPGSGKHPCIRPQRFVNLRTGEIEWGRCHATTVDVCPGCAHLYQEDARTIIRSGLIQHLEAGDPVTFVTLTAPGLWLPGSAPAFQRMHRYYPGYWELLSQLRVNRARIRKEASLAVCGHCTDQARSQRPPGVASRDILPLRHRPDDPIGGLPVFLEAFDYPAAVLWNFRIGELWHRTVTYLRRIHGGQVQFVKVLEWSRRGVPHVHALLTAALTSRDIQNLVASVNHSYRDGRPGWGGVFDIQRLTVNGDGNGVRDVARLTSYLGKYLTKTSGGGLPNTAGDNRHAEAHLARLSWAARDLARRQARR